MDYRSKLWTCAFCTARNHFPPHYAENISETSLPAELIPQFTTVEYELQTPGTGPPTFLFVIDTCLDEDELSQLKDALQQTLQLLPEDALVGLITFGTLVQVHELGFSDCPRAYVFRGEREYTPQKIQEMLAISPSRPGMPMNHPNSGNMPGNMPMPALNGRLPAIGRFLMPVGECTFLLEQILEDLQRDPWPCKPEERVQRCTGVALTVALGLLETAVPRQGSRLLLFTAGPPTVGPGSIVSRSKKESIRSHTDIAKRQAPLLKPALDFYQALSDRAVAAHIAMDLFSCSLDQVGALELKSLVARTGGVVVLGDKFSQSIFRESLRRVFLRSASNAAEGAPASTGHLQMGFGAQIEVMHSREFKISGAIGPVASLKKAGPTVSETEVGIG